MTTSLRNNKYLIQLDGIRALAVMIVMISHFITYKAVLKIPLGSMGVNIFFVLSGFLITRILLNAKDEIKQNNTTLGLSIKRFYTNRTLRIFPVYYLVIAVLYIIDFSETRSVSFWLYTYLMNIKFAMPGVFESKMFGSFTHFWSLCVEEQFYLFFPVVVYALPKKYLKSFFFILIGIGVLSRLVLLLINAAPNSLYVFPTSCLDAFGIGALLAYYYLYAPDTLNKTLSNTKAFLLSGIVYIACIILSRIFIPDYGECRTVLERFLFCVFCFYLVGIAAIGGIKGTLKKILEHKITIYIGKISYGLYIYHNFVPEFFDFIAYKFPIKPIVILNSHNLTRSFMFFIITFIIASISWYILEAPISKLKKKYI